MRADLDAFASAPPPATTVAEQTSVTTIVDVPGVGPEVAQTCATKIPAILKGRRSQDPPLRADVVFDSERSHLKVILVGPAGDVSIVLGAVDQWLDRL